MATTDERTAVEFAKCAADAAYLTHEYLVIDDSQGHGDGGGVMPFHLWPAQVGVLWRLQTERLIIILKARQLGISWICCAYALWLALFHPGKVVLIFSKGQLEANKMLGRIKKLYERLPPWLSAALPARTTDNTTIQGWANGSRIESLPATEDAGRSDTASLVILDEAAFLQWADKLYSALKPTIDNGGQLVVLSTANGIGNLYHQLWIKAQARLNSFHAIFLPWWSRPGRDAVWYAAQLAEYTDPRIVKQEYPANPNEAFLVSGRTRFDPDWLALQVPHLQDGLPASQILPELRAIPRLTVYTLPAPGVRYVIGADVAEGLAHGDYDAAVILDARTWEEVAYLHGHWEPDVYAGYLDVLATVYAADLAVERNNHGHAVLVALKTLGTPGIVLGDDDRPGHLTTTKSKPLAIDLLAQALHQQLCTVHSASALNEMQIYRILNNGATSAPTGYYDDLVMAWAIALTTARRPAAHAGVIAQGKAKGWNRR